MSNLTVLNPQIEKNSITTVEISEIIGASHKSILQKLEGSNRNGEHSEGVIDILSRLNFQPSDFFIPSDYTNERGKTYKCYLCTRMGCEFLAHKFTGEKGILFTAQYIKRFHEMEQALMSENKQRLLADGTDWYGRNRNRINACCRKMKIPNKQFCHMLLEKIKETHNIQQLRKEIYKREGKYPQYYLNIIDFYDELVPIADAFLADMEKFLSIKK